MSFEHVFHVLDMFRHIFLDILDIFNIFRIFEIFKTLVIFSDFCKFLIFLTSYHKFSQVFTSFHIFSKESTQLMAMALFIPIRCMMRFHSQTTFIRVIFVSSSIWGGQVEGNKYVTAVSS